MKFWLHSWFYICYGLIWKNNDFYIFDRVPSKYICYLNETVTLKFDPSKDEPGDPGWSCINSEHTECIPKRHICDGIEDCKFGSDEERGCELYAGIFMHCCYYMVFVNNMRLKPYNIFF